MLPVYIPLPFIDKSINNIEIPVTWQIPTLILLTLMYHKRVVYRALSLYIFFTNELCLNLASYNPNLIVPPKFLFVPFINFPFLFHSFIKAAKFYKC